MSQGMQSPPADVTAQLVITMTTGGQVSITGPIENSILCYGMLLAGYQALLQRSQEAQRLVHVARLVPPRNGGP